MRKDMTKDYNTYKVEREFEVYNVHCFSYYCLVVYV